MKQSSRRRLRPALDHLEDRLVLTALGTTWPDPTHLSLSFAPDGTRDGGQVSALYQIMGTAGATSAWQQTIVRAFQSWAAVANLGVGVAADGGQPFGSAGPAQGDARFGDIRVGAISQSPGVLAVTQPFSYSAGSWAGDVNFNSADILSLDGRAGTEDLYTLALHEAGHTLGLADNADSSSAMYASYQGPRTGLSSADVAAIQAIYGQRPTGSTANVSPSSPTWISPARSDGSNFNASGVVVTDSISSVAAQHYYKFSPDSSGTYSIDVKTAGFSSLLTKVTAYGQNGQVIGTATATDPTSGDLILTLNNPNEEGNYRFTIQAAGSDVFSVGNYAVRVLPAGLSPTTVLTSDVYTNGFVNVDSGTNDSIATATVLSLNPATCGYQRLGSLTPTDALDYYRLTAPASGSSVMMVSAYAPGASTLSPSVTVYDASGNPVAATIVRNQAGAEVLQVSGIAAGATYYVGVAADGTQGSATGNYGLSVQFRAAAEARTLLGSGTLSPTTSGGTTTWGAPPAMTLTPDPNGIVHLSLANDTGSSSAATSVLVTIRDAAGNVVATLSAGANRTQSLELWLGRGTYTVTVTAAGTATGTPVPMKWSLYCDQLSDPLLSTGYTGKGSSTTTYPPGQQPPPPPPPPLP